jgi:UV DNA damage endonuclease
LKDCLEVNKKTEIPIVFDTYHHQCLNNGESFKEAFLKVKKVWKEKDGVPMIDYSEQEEGKRKGVHAQTLTVSTFENFLKEMKEFDFDIMFEIKDKEKSALKAVKVL